MNHVEYSTPNQLRVIAATVTHHADRDGAVALNPARAAALAGLLDAEALRREAAAGSPSFDVFAAAWRGETR